MSTKEPHQTGGSVQGSLRGRCFELLVEANEWSCTSWAGSSYYPRLQTSYWYQGEAKIYRIPRKKPIACFLTSFSRPPMRGTLEDGILNLRELHLSDKLVKEWIVPDRRDALIDFLCQRAVAEYRKQRGTCVPKVSLFGMAYQELIDNGFAFDEEGQVRLPLVA
jgi:hypothetical protein